MRIGTGALSIPDEPMVSVVVEQPGHRPRSSGPFWAAFPVANAKVRLELRRQVSSVPSS